jgi:hypothetical protein
MPVKTLTDANYEEFIAEKDIARECGRLKITHRFIGGNVPPIEIPVRGADG